MWEENPIINYLDEIQTFIEAGKECLTYWKDNYNIIMKPLSFEWDFEKAKKNFRKHGITFEEASTVFSDEAAILFDDPEHSEEE